MAGAIVGSHCKRSDDSPLSGNWWDFNGHVWVPLFRESFSGWGIQLELTGMELLYFRPEFYWTKMFPFFYFFCTMLRVLIAETAEMLWQEMIIIINVTVFQSKWSVILKDVSSLCHPKFLLCVLLMLCSLYRLFQSITANFGWTIHDRESTQLDVSGSAVIVIRYYFFHSWQHWPLWRHSKWLRH
jgi:hypothetical protein